MDLEGNERADELADEGVKKHGVRLAAEGKKSEQQRGQSNKRALQNGRRKGQEWKQAHNSQSLTHKHNPVTQA